jgi:hypothetical protein
VPALLPQEAALRRTRREDGNARALRQSARSRCRSHRQRGRGVRQVAAGSGHRRFRHGDHVRCRRSRRAPARHVAGAGSTHCHGRVVPACGAPIAHRARAT